MAPGARGGRASGWEWQQAGWSLNSALAVNRTWEGPACQCGWWVARGTRGRVSSEHPALLTQPEGPTSPWPVHHHCTVSGGGPRFYFTCAHTTVTHRYSLLGGSGVWGLSLCHDLEPL